MKKYILLAGGIVISGIIIYQTYTLNSIKKELFNMNSLKTSLQEELSGSLNNINSDIQNTLEEELAKSYITKDVDFKLNKNIENGYDITVTVELNQLKDDSKVLFMYRDESKKEWKEIELSKSAELSYSGDIILNYDNSYEYKVVTKGDISESSDVEVLDKYLFLPTAPDANWNYNEEGIYFNTYLDEYSSSEESYQQNDIKNIQVIIKSGSKEKTYTCEYKEDSMYDENEGMEYISKYYEVDIPKSDYPNKIDSIKMKITYENGIIDVKDITDSRG